MKTQLIFLTLYLFTLLITKASANAMHRNKWRLYRELMADRISVHRRSSRERREWRVTALIHLFVPLPLIYSLPDPLVFILLALWFLVQGISIGIAVGHGYTNLRMKVLMTYLG